jgi:energy-coupling factor transport system permease protein
MLQSLSEGFAIVGMMGVFGAFNSVVSHSELVESTPRAFFEIGLVVVVGLAFVPSTLTAIQQVREADRARTGGRPIRKGRLLRQIVPVLELGLERAVTLAESMDSRGFARLGASARDRIAGWWGAASLLMLAGAFVALVGQAGTVATTLALAGAVGLGAAVVLASSGNRRVRYRPRRMRRRDWTIGLVALLAPLAMAAVSVVGDSSLVWYASPLSWPALHLLPALALMPLLVPALVPPEMTA